MLLVSGLIPDWPGGTMPATARMRTSGDATSRTSPELGDVGRRFVVREDPPQLGGDLFSAVHRGPVEAHHVAVLREEGGKALGVLIVPRIEQLLVHPDRLVHIGLRIPVSFSVFPRTKHRSTPTKSIVLSAALSIISQTSVRAALSRTGTNKSSIRSPALVLSLTKRLFDWGKVLRVDNGPLRVLGIDPGLTRMGFGVVQETRGKLEALACGTLTTSPTQETSTRLMMLFEQLRLVLIEWRPDAGRLRKALFRRQRPVCSAGGSGQRHCASTGCPVRPGGAPSTRPFR